PLELEENPDILAELGARESPGERPILVGFAAETHEIERAAAEKLRKKRCDLLVANDVSAAGSGFQTDTNRVLVLAPDREPEWFALASKDEIADRILDRLHAILVGRGA